MLETLFAMDPWILLTFTGAGILLNLTPGVDVVFASACGISGGPRAGIAAAFGITLGSVMHVALAVFGISTAIMAIPQAYDVIRYGGAAYLLWLAYKSWRADLTESNANGVKTLSTALRRGFLTNALNPKVALFILAFLPQFTDPTIGPVWQQMLVLGILFMTTGMAITSAYGVLAGYMGRALQSSGRLLNHISAVIFAGLAARLILD